MARALGMTVIIVALAAGLFVALSGVTADVLEVSTAGLPMGIVVDCGNALAPATDYPGYPLADCQQGIRGKQFLAGGIGAAGLVLGIGLVIAGTRSRHRSVPGATPALPSRR